MSHTYNYGSVTFVCNSDLSGEVRICKHRKSGLDEGCVEQEITIPCESILDFVAEYVRSQRISRLEDMTAEQVLGICKEGNMS